MAPVGTRWQPLARQRTKCRGNNARPLRSVGVRWRPLARQRTRCRGNYTCSLRSVGVRWHPLARQRTKNIRNNILFRDLLALTPFGLYNNIDVRGRAWERGARWACAQAPQHCRPDTPAYGVTQVGIAFGKIRSAGEASTRREMLDGGWLALANVGVSASSVCYLLRWLV